MAERNDWDHDRERERARSDWDRWRSNRDVGEQPRDDWDREHARESRRPDPRRNESGQWDEFGRGLGTESRTYWPERGDYSTRGDWGRQGTSSVYRNRPDYERENEWRRNQGAGDWGQRNPGEWSQGPGGEWEPGRREPYGRFGESEYGRMGAYGGGMGSYAGGMGMYSRRGPFAGRGPKGWQRSDERIKDDVSERLTDHPDIDASNLEVQVQGAEVTLTGTVDHRDTKRLAEDIAHSVSGVRDVHNQIRVENPSMREPGTVAGVENFPRGK